MAKGVCPECGAEIEIEDPVEKEIVECEECGVELEVSKVDGDEVEFELAESEGEDWGE
ncbi:MAG: sulfonate ABC transporter [Candidatus Odinarchaeum yellowstonii]|jgi:alpha-aminoadipate carrier protein LysW|uniref:Sulfonate ABC transporter n=1 Tax=Odinarchaeota yellowstonii (strain LCB_4) TaxID=1841599 RepID=A0AAF0D2K4_ODILC|nr:MAG: sulfonate ABC transporter [Candidatus Odinarchaeum yellowstonii]